MEDDILKFIQDTFEIEIDSKYHFKKLYGLTFVYRDDVISTKNSINAYSLTPLGIIYDEKEEYYFAPIDESATISDVVQEYVKQCL